MKRRINLFAASAIVAAMTIACSFSTANMSSFKASKDKEGKQETTTLKAGETLYANAIISNSPGKTTTKIYLQDDKGKTMSGSEVSVDLSADGKANYSLPLPMSFPGGKYKLIADMLDDKGEKKDSKSVDLTIEAAPAAPKTADDSGDDAADDKGGDSDKKDDN
ncbi:MAG: hypothetical protein IPM50_02045 [Acidobacteriota bacterium]|nr:MAG: hypothetical protein IPM50_02045 [Acidobacteriota bacterium]